MGLHQLQMAPLVLDESLLLFYNSRKSFLDATRDFFIRDK